jgi:hypothetical protein
MTNIERLLCSCPLVYRREKVTGTGCNGYIEKPIDPDTFEVQVGKYLSMKVHKEGRQ